jgi:hypothetical protein
MGKNVVVVVVVFVVVAVVATVIVIVVVVVVRGVKVTVAEAMAVCWYTSALHVLV